MANPQQKSNRDHSFDSELASLVGIEKAILLKNISYWVEENERRKIESSFAYGKWWTLESLTSLAKKYPYMKRGNLSRWFKELKRDKWILMYNTTDGANMYAPGPVFNSWNLGQDWQVVFQNETGRAYGEVFQNEPKAVFQNETEAAAQNETHNNVESNIEKNVELEGEREAKKTPPPETFDEMLEQVNDQVAALEAEKKKAPQVAARPPLTWQEEQANVISYYDHTNRSKPSDPTHTVTTVDPDIIPGNLTKIVEGVSLEETTREKISAENSIEAAVKISKWCSDEDQTVRYAYEMVKRKYSSDDIQTCVIKFCGHFTTKVEDGVQSKFLRNPAKFFQDGLTKWLLTQNEFDRKEAAKAAQPRAGFSQPEQKSNLPKSIRRF